MTGSASSTQEIRDRLVLRAGGDDLGSLYPWFEAIVTRLELPSSAAFRIHVVLEEAATNAAIHGYAPGAAGEVALDIAATPERVVAVLRDTGRPFNPLLETPPTPTPASLEEAAIGGLGITFMRKFCSELSYRRADETNELTMGFDVNAMAAP
jgi:anti-sigma regulatory factor (Ser/Thr protein kinase)